MAKARIVIVVGASAGGSTALPELIRQIPVETGVTVMAVLHLSKAHIGELLVRRLQKFTALKCRIPKHGEEMQEGCVYVAMPDHHLMVKKNRILLGRGPMENRYRPSIDALFRSAAANFPARVIGIILTGLLEDGTAGMQAIRRCSGICIIQDPGEAKYADMPRAVLNVLKPDFIAGVPEMGEAIDKSIRQLKKKKNVKVPPDILKEAQIAERVNVGIENLQDLGKLSPISCPDCGGSLWELDDHGLARYRCHVGHSFSEEGLINNIESSSESTLWVALRMLEERKNLLKQIAQKESGKGKSQLASTYLKKSAELEAHAKKLKEILFKVSVHPK